MSSRTAEDGGAWQGQVMRGCAHARRGAPAHTADKQPHCAIIYLLILAVAIRAIFIVEAVNAVAVLRKNIAEHHLAIRRMFAWPSEEATSLGV